MNWTIHWLTTAFDGLVSFLPNLIAALFVLFVGWIIASVLRRLTRALAHRFGFDRLVARLGVSSAIDEGQGSRWLGGAVFAVVMLVAILQAARSLNLGFVATGLAAVVAYLPHVLAAALVFGAALFCGNWVQGRLYRMRGAGEGTTTNGAGRMLPGIVRAIIIGLGVFMALRELQIAPEIVNLAFMLTLGAVAVAAALAFGLGGREVAGRIAQTWYDRRGALSTRDYSARASS